jgi:hypothetical protein
VVSGKAGPGEKGSSNSNGLGATAQPAGSVAAKPAVPAQVAPAQEKPPARTGWTTRLRDMVTRKKS